MDALVNYFLRSCVRIAYNASARGGKNHAVSNKQLEGLIDTSGISIGIREGSVEGYRDKRTGQHKPLKGS